jgi:hypothetical protein
MPSSRSPRLLPCLVRSSALLLLLTVGGCGGTASGEQVGPRPEERDLQLSAQISLSADALAVSYSLTNHGSDMVVAFTGIPVEDSTSVPRADPNAVYVTAGDGAVQLAKRVFSQPKGGSAPLLVRGTGLVGGESLKERVVVPLPLVARVPYRGADEKAEKLPDPVRTIQFCVGTALQNQIDSTRPAPTDSDTRLAYPHGPGVEGKQAVICSPPVALPA